MSAIAGQLVLAFALYLAIATLDVFSVAMPRGDVLSRIVRSLGPLAETVGLKGANTVSFFLDSLALCHNEWLTQQQPPLWLCC